jgi:hypothetical protein
MGTAKVLLVVLVAALQQQQGQAWARRHLLGWGI